VQADAVDGCAELGQGRTARRREALPVGETKAPQPPASRHPIRGQRGSNLNALFCKAGRYVLGLRIADEGCLYGDSAITWIILARWQEPRLSRLQAWIAGLVVTVLAVVLSFVWVDRPVAMFFYALFGRPDVLEVGTWGVFIPFVALAVVSLVVRRLAARPIATPDIVLALVGLSVAICEAIKSPLKFLFGRTWPLGLFRRHVYGFFPFHTGPQYAAFPSGHTAAVFTVLFVLWIWYPRFRPAYVAIAMVCAAVLVAASYHFVGDVIAGAFVGITAGMLAQGIWDMWRRRHPSSAWAQGDGM